VRRCGRFRRRAVAVLAAVCGFAASAAAQDDPSALGGAATLRVEGVDAFGFPAPGLDAAERRAFAVGNSFFRKNWVASPASATGRDGLGPLFNARSCAACHLRDGRSRPPEPDEPNREGLLLRIGVRTPGGPDLRHPLYGVQIQDAAVLGVRPEARATIDYRVVRGAYGDGEPFELLAPIYGLAEPAYGPVGVDAVLGPRTAPALIGLGLLEAVPDADLLALADPDDADGDGVSGRAHVVAGEGPASRVVGRFGWKATQPTVRLQTAAAFVHDIGITSPAFPTEDLAPAQRAALGPAPAGETDLDAHKLDRVAFYTATLAVPARRSVDDPLVRRGEGRFAAFRCDACHVPALTTGDAAVHPSFRLQRIRPYSDLLLHDLGAGLADGKTDGEARPSEWRTPPLWGIGLQRAVSGHERLLHDGRARGFAEAILWHGGEAEAAKERFRTAPRAEREALLAFLRSL
jgi:CxxC motif-containing protein (DUF1111 family)